MHVGLHSYSRRQAFAQPGYDVFTFLDEAAAWGFRAVEVMTGKAGGCEHIASDDVPYLRRVAAHAVARELRLACWSTYNDFSITSAEPWRLDNIRYIQDWIVKAAATNVPNLRFLTGYIPAGEDPARLERLVEAATRACCVLAERHGVNLALENHSAVFPYAADILRLRAAVGSPRLTTCPDPSNGFPVQQPQADTLTRMYANLALLAPHASNAHLKVFGVEGQGLACFDVDRVIGILGAAGFTGSIQLELPDASAPTDLLRRARDVVDAAIRRAGAAP